MSHTTRETLVLALLALVCAGGCASRREGYSEVEARAAASAPVRAQRPDAAETRIDSSGDAAAALEAAPLATATELDLASLRARVLESNPSLAAMHATWQAAIARHPQATAFDDPEFFYGLAPGTLGAGSIDFGQKIELRQRLPWPGKRRFAGEAALDEARAAGHDFDAIRIALLELTDTSFFELYFVERAIEINRSNQELLADLERIARARYGAGLASKQDALLAEVESHHLLHDGIVLARERAVVAARLNTLLDFPPETPVPPAPTRLLAPPSPPARERLQELALARRPELGALALRLRASESEAQLARRSTFPDLTLMAGYDSLMEESERRGMLGVGVDLPLQLGRRRAAVVEAEAMQRSRRAELDRQRSQVLFEVSSALDGLAESHHVVHLYDASIVPAAEESLAAARSGYESGGNDFLTLIAAEKNLMLARLSYEQALSQVHQRSAGLERAVGTPLSALEEKP